MKKNLFKKVAALVTATSMIASLGTVAFAENYSGNGINITNVNAQKAVNNDGAVVDGVYDVTVSYEVADGVTNAIGVTMLAYAGENLSVDASDYTKYNTSMQIVGIDQQEQTAQTGTFEFRVTTKGDDDAIKVTYDVPSIILVSGDNVTPAAATLLITTPREGKTAASAEFTYAGTAIEYYSYENLADKIKIALADLADTATLKDAEGNVIGTAPISGANITSVAKKDDTTYTVTVKIPAGTVATSDTYDVTIPADINVPFDVPVGLVPWAVVSAEYNEGNTMAIEPQADADAVIAAIEDKLANDGVKLMGADEKAVKTLEGEDLDVTVTLAGETAYDPNNAEDQVLTYNVAVNFEGDSEAAVTETSELTFALTVTVSDIPAVVYGDMNGDGKFNMADGLIVLKMGLSIDNKNHYPEAGVEPSNEDKTKADVNGDGKYNMADVLLILRHGLSDSNPNYLEKFPVEK